MRDIRPGLEWDDPLPKLEPGDNVWQAGLRRQQAWWRRVELGLDPGPGSGAAKRRLVSTMLPERVPLATNIWTVEARDAVDRAVSGLKGRAGIIQEDRLRRNLLSSQPLAFNLFGYLAATPTDLLPWVRRFSPAAAEVTDVRLEWAPKGPQLGGSAFDAFVEYRTSSSSTGCIGVEVKYHEDLAKSYPKPAPERYAIETDRRGADWKAGSPTHLDLPRLRQFWFNQILAQRTRDELGASEYTQVVVACDADQAARDATGAVSARLIDEERLQFSSIEDVVASVIGHEVWSSTLVRRYLDFTPIELFLKPGDPRRP